MNSNGTINNNNANNANGVVLGLCERQTEYLFWENSATQKENVPTVINHIKRHLFIGASDATCMGRDLHNLLSLCIEIGRSCAYSFRNR